jgi:hypothetical protein
MKGHLYRITVEHLEDNKGNPVARAPMVFETKNHDDLFDIVERIRAKDLFDPEVSRSFTIGLKLFREVMLHNRGNTVFTELDPHMSEFMKALKNR